MTSDSQSDPEPKAVPNGMPSEESKGPQGAESGSNSGSTPVWLAWLRLARISNLPSALSNILMGVLLSYPSWSHVLWSKLALLLLSSACLYTAGMILNDFFDVESDRENSPSRPIPSGVVSRGLALNVGIFLCFEGLLFAFLAGDGWFSLPLVVASVLTLCIWLYNGVLKKTFAAPAVMGFCRTLNVLLGASAVSVDRIGSFELGEGENAILGFHPIAWWVALAIGIYVTGITLFARTEHESQSARWRLGFGLGTMVAGISAIAFFPWQFAEVGNRDDLFLGGFFPVLVLLISVTIVRSGLFAIWNPSPKHVKFTVITSLRSMLIFDACLAFLLSGRLTYAIVIISFIPISLLLGMKIRST